MGHEIQQPVSIIFRGPGYTDFRVLVDVCGRINGFVKSHFTRNAVQHRLKSHASPCHLPQNAVQHKHTANLVGMLHVRF